MCVGCYGFVMVTVVHMIHNKTGPLSASGCVTELRAALTGPSALPHHKEQQRSQDNTFWPLEERLSNMEEYLQVHNKSECCQKVVVSKVTLEFMTSHMPSVRWTVLLEELDDCCIRVS